MTSSFDPAYAYARACGALARSFLGERAQSLARCGRVAEAWRIIFREEPPSLPEGLLANEAEKRLGSSARDAARAIAGARIFEAPLFKALDRRREIAYLKRLLAAAVSDQGIPSGGESFAEGCGFSIEAFPDIERMLRGGRYAWIAEGAVFDLRSVKIGLDKRYFRELAEIARSSRRLRASSIASLVLLEAELANVVWAQRLKRYYSIGEERAAELLIDIPGADLASSALRALSFRHDARSDWKGWKWERLVPDTRAEGSGSWRLDLRALEVSASGFLYRKLVRALHMGGDALTPLYCFMRIKEIESAALRGILEGIKLEAPEEEIAAYVEQLTGGAA